MKLFAKTRYVASPPEHVEHMDGRWLVCPRCGGMCFLGIDLYWEYRREQGELLCLWCTLSQQRDPKARLNILPVQIPQLLAAGISEGRIWRLQRQIERILRGHEEPPAEWKARIRAREERDANHQSPP